MNDLTSSPQPSFGLGPQPQATDRLFFAVFPDAATATEIAATAAALRAEHRLRGKTLHPDRFHVTLHHLGDYVGLPEGMAEKAGAAAARVDMAAFDAAFDQAASFSRQPRNRPFVLRGEAGVAGLQDLQSALGAAMGAVGLQRLVDRRFTPHVTLLYDDCAVAPQPIKRIAWQVREFVLVHSLLGKTEHRILGRWPLHPAG